MSFKLQFSDGRNWTQIKKHFPIVKWCFCYGPRPLKVSNGQALSAIELVDIPVIIEKKGMHCPFIRRMHPWRSIVILNIQIERGGGRRK
ncbi:hypothetical protein CEXT_354261 [Caerostris extrusa]|uniref:Uncharacterized protein n=1 Tax=Caerostris extrusa TaxID=172846 RepID=A0AAV4UVS7_CAEEX|nr:hypothetical protein CEXT_354261 [Caerostris extrusa]